MSADKIIRGLREAVSIMRRLKNGPGVPCTCPVCLGEAVGDNLVCAGFSNKARITEISEEEMAALRAAESPEAT